MSSGSLLEVVTTALRWGLTKRCRCLTGQASNSSIEEYTVDESRNCVFGIKISKFLIIFIEKTLQFLAARIEEQFL